MKVYRRRVRVVGVCRENHPPILMAHPRDGQYYSTGINDEMLIDWNSFLSQFPAHRPNKQSGRWGSAGKNRA